MSERKFTTDEHFVPKFYLQNFTNDSGQVWVYDRLNKKRFSQIPDNICYKKDLYETKAEGMNPALGEYVLRNQLENIFCQYEGAWSKLIKQVLCTCRLNIDRNALICNAEQKRQLAEFISNLILRNPITMANSELDEISVAKQLEETKAVEHLFNLLGFGSINSVLRFINKSNHFNDEFGTQRLLADELLKMDMCFIYNEENDFVTSCCPVFYGMRDNESSITDVIVPLSTDILLLYGISENTKKYRNRIGRNPVFSMLLKFLYLFALSPEK
ncbi:MAG: DUF4238 domain-containing protein, partial [Alphaproteobacteria bacterium]|nr:DUF4238 domain-containing protein [Alphaproteobacteria bacterium]